MKIIAMQTNVLFGVFGIIDIILLISDLIKFLSGGYIHVGIGLSLFFVIPTLAWGRGRILRDLLIPEQKVSQLKVH